MIGIYDRREAVRQRNEAAAAERAELLAVLKECHEAMAYMSEYDIPIGLPDRVKVALVKAGVALDE